MGYAGVCRNIVIIDLPGFVRSGAVLDDEISQIQHLRAMAAARASLEQEVPMTATIVGSAASLVARSLTTLSRATAILTIELDIMTQDLATCVIDSDLHTIARVRS